MKLGLKHYVSELFPAPYHFALPYVTYPIKIFSCWAIHFHPCRIWLATFVKTFILLIHHLYIMINILLINFPCSWRPTTFIFISLANAILDMMIYIWRFEMNRIEWMLDLCPTLISMLLFILETRHRPDISRSLLIKLKFVAFLLSNTFLKYYFCISTQFTRVI